VEPVLTPMKALLPLAVVVLLSACAGSQISPELNSTLVNRGVGPATIVKMENGSALDYQDISNLVSKGIPAHSIISYLESTQKVYDFGPVQLNALREQGAPSQLINYLQETRGFYGRTSSKQRQNTSGESNAQYYNTPLYQDEQPFAYNEPLVDSWYDSSYEESLYSPFSYN